MPRGQIARNAGRSVQLKSLVATISERVVADSLGNGVSDACGILTGTSWQRTVSLVTTRIALHSGRSKQLESVSAAVRGDGGPVLFICVLATVGGSGHPHSGEVLHVPVFILQVTREGPNSSRPSSQEYLMVDALIHSLTAFGEGFGTRQRHCGNLFDEGSIDQLSCRKPYTDCLTVLSNWGM